MFNYDCKSIHEIFKIFILYSYIFTSCSFAYVLCNQLLILFILVKYLCRDRQVSY